MNESIHGERTASVPQDRSSIVARSIEVPSEIILKWQEIVNLLAEIMHVPSASIMRVDPPHIKVFVSSTSEGNPCEPGALDTGPYCETVMKTGARWGDGAALVSRCSSLTLSRTKHGKRTRMSGWG
jgi:hypothetical protein